MTRFIQIFFLIGLGLIIGEVFDITVLRLATRLVMVPLVVFMYYRSVERINYLMLTVFIMCYLGDISTYFDYTVALKYTAVFFGLCHIILATFSFSLIKEKSVKRLLLTAIPIAVIWIVYYEHYFNDVFGLYLGNLYPYILSYSIALVVLNVMANVSFFNEGSQLTLYLIIIAVAIVVGDVLMCYYMFATPIHLFKVINAVSHLVVYFFLLKFALEYSDFKLKSPSL
ncbi:hypothetical protein GWK08_07610 [Leptobacterium flavescens]|uniref:Lysoplasmalogenase n=1 Tax=Leptobacterium flavescens TaxID=472055 RepID=A0A6P0UN79_9FLAO|nr:hypothetical protein [Leptobacterium flavescens]NER13299.1 hypothetical protein [Leptobacterium flavescens]